MVGDPKGMFLVTIVVSLADANPLRLLALRTLRLSLTPGETASCEYKYHLLSFGLSQINGFL